MRVVPEGRPNRQLPDEFGVDDLPIQETFGVELLGRRSLTETAREPRTFLPPPRVRPRRHISPPREPESRFSKVAKLAGLTTASTLLVGAVVASSMVTRARTEQTGRSTPAPPAITGAAALGGFAMQDSVKPGRDRHSSPATTHTQKPATSEQPSPTGLAWSATGTSEAPPASPAPSTTKAPIDDKLTTVNQFYQLMGSQRPQDALAMLAPALAGDQPGDLVRAWSSMSQVEAKDVHVQPDGSVLAVVDMVRRDGTHLRVTQVLELTGGLIEQAVLLSAEQL
ncbi:hypothetical protein [Amycolatopsis taiwanensis]|uniref:Uncharacterized protein n=1 Tax=Amycolatopsis taiwanensis TaxID=342230 RepID=A0A9W6QUY3_9PSEU|nr:hypothetical protein [Amycolatopsis taiwanensis]GLY63450.1 hypothetical protein Atai01_00690 [Amycolatopsis taiwanensis]